MVEHRPIDSYYNPIKEIRAEKQKKQELAWKQYSAQKELDELKRLQEKYKTVEEEKNWPLAPLRSEVSC